MQRSSISADWESDHHRGQKDHEGRQDILDFIKAGLQLTLPVFARGGFEEVEAFPRRIGRRKLIERILENIPQNQMLDDATPKNHAGLSSSGSQRMVTTLSANIYES